jgi:hypothetical protein
VNALLALFATLLQLAAPEAGSKSAPPAAEGALREFIRNGIAAFHERRLERLETLDLEKVLARKNPYLLKARNLTTAEALVEDLLGDHLSIQESSLFGAFVEQLAIHVCEKAYGGRKSAVEGVDLEFEREATKYIVSVKSGPNWGNSSSIKKMEDHFRKAKRILGSNTAAGGKVIAVNGCCYGKVATEDKGDYLKLCGKNFWSLISGDEMMYHRIMSLIGDESAKQSAAFDASYTITLARFAEEFEAAYCDDSGAINWSKLVEKNSG